MGKQTKHPVLAKLRPVLTFLWATASILLILAALYTAFRGNIR